MVNEGEYIDIEAQASPLKIGPPKIGLGVFVRSPHKVAKYRFMYRINAANNENISHSKFSKLMKVRLKYDILFFALVFRVFKI